METSNVKGMREALKMCYDALARAQCDREPIPSEVLVACCSAAEKALDEPPRNCDVGTAEEQYERYDGFCAKHYDSGGNCLQCPFSEPLCKFAWAQMAYSGSEADDGSK